MTLGNGTSTAYEYDPQGALSRLAHDLAGGTNDVAYTYTRNQAQEIVSQTWSNPAYAWRPDFNRNRGTTVNGLNPYRQYGPHRFTYDNAGNLSSDGNWSWGYDTDNRLTSASRAGSSVQLAYDALGRLRRENLTTGGTTASTQFLYDGTDRVAEYDGAGTLLRRHVHGPGVDEPLVSYEGTTLANKTWLYADHLGSIVAEADSAGHATATQGYGPFGEPSRTTGSRFKFTGQVFLPSLGLYYYKARFYSPTLGRFLQTDPVGYADNLNLYAYVGNNPVNFLDPRGLTSWEATALTSGLGASRLDWSQGIQVAGLPAALVAIMGVGLTLTDVANSDLPVPIPGGTLTKTGVKLAGSAAAKGGRLGNEATRAHVGEVATEMEKRGWKITGGGGRGPEEYLPGPGGARRGSSYPDITATKDGKTLRVNTVGTRADGVTPTTREATNAARIRAQTGEHVLTIPKP